jgi:hypothetical protein
MIDSLPMASTSAQPDSTYPSSSHSHDHHHHHHHHGHHHKHPKPNSAGPSAFALAHILVPNAHEIPVLPSSVSSRQRQSPHDMVPLDQAIKSIHDVIGSQGLGVETHPVSPSFPCSPFLVFSKGTAFCMSSSANLTQHSIQCFQINATLPGHILAEDISSPHPLPLWHSTNVDGYAVMSQQFSPFHLPPFGRPKLTLVRVTFLLRQHPMGRGTTTFDLEGPAFLSSQTKLSVSTREDRFRMERMLSSWWKIPSCSLVRLLSPLPLFLVHLAFLKRMLAVYPRRLFYSFVDRRRTPDSNPRSSPEGRERSEARVGYGPRRGRDEEWGPRRVWRRRDRCFERGRKKRGPFFLSAPSPLLEIRV